VAGRFAVGAVTAGVVGWWWHHRRVGDLEAVDAVSVSSAMPGIPRGWSAFWASWRRDVVRGGSALAVAASVVAALNALCPPSWVELVALRPTFSVIAIALLAVLLCAPAESNAFVAAALTPFSATARLVFISVGPMVDIRRFGAQARVFAPRSALRLGPALFLVGLVVAAGVAALAAGR
jgi:uncharacterized membrane protein YraQ (UPF0718 family)